MVGGHNKVVPEVTSDRELCASSEVASRTFSASPGDCSQKLSGPGA